MCKCIGEKGSSIRYNQKFNSSCAPKNMSKHDSNLFPVYFCAFISGVKAKFCTRWNFWIYASLNHKLLSSSSSIFFTLCNSLLRCYGRPETFGYFQYCSWICTSVAFHRMCVWCHLLGKFFFIGQLNYLISEWWSWWSQSPNRNICACHTLN